MRRQFVFWLLVLPFGMASVAFTYSQQPKPWTVPDKDAKAVNPLKANAETLSSGKSLWNQHCASCHGKTGLGDGNKAAQLKTEPGNFTMVQTQAQSDGSL